MTPDEEWRPVVGYEGWYEVSNLGRVRGLTRWVSAKDGGRQLVRGRVKRLFNNPRGNVIVLLHRNGQQRCCVVSRLVAASFIGPCPIDMEVCHNNGDHTDNRPENLRYDTHRENIVDQVRHGTHAKSSRDACKWGHEYVGDSYYMYKGARRCRVCQAEHNSRIGARRKAERRARRERAA